jgi:hypothetical protein
MKIFKLDGKSWVAQLHDGSADRSTSDVRAGWEVVQFDTQPASVSQRIAYRPPGWLSRASIADLIDALREASAVRTSW